MPDAAATTCPTVTGVPADHRAISRIVAAPRTYPPLEDPTQILLSEPTRDAKGERGNK
jgi:hypothetical protein